VAVVLVLDALILAGAAARGALSDPPPVRPVVVVGSQCIEHRVTQIVDDGDPGGLLAVDTDTSC
jgi:hypothetical protein